jgi:hypothetical protein
MRAFLVFSAALGLVTLVGCATSGRTQRDAHVGGTDAGHGVDAGPITPDTGGGGHDAGGGGHDAGSMSMPDMGGIVRPDAFVPDTGGPTPDTGCANDAQCQDGLGCNGMERCVAGACMPATSPMSCNDGLSCTTDTCVEPGTCMNVSTCAGGAACMASGCATGCAESPCRLLSPQCGCAAGQACYPSGATRVCTTSGSGTSGSLCTTNSDCAATYACLNVSTGTTAVNLCTHMCSSDAECGGGLCIYQLDDGTGTAVPGLTLCSHPCNAATGLGCPSGTVCTLFSESGGAMRTFTDCTAPTTGTGEDMGCDTTAPTCSPNRYCIDTGDGLGPACHHWCNFSTGAGCSAGHTCFEFSPPIMINGIDYGVCST